LKKQKLEITMSRSLNNNTFYLMELVSQLL